jgi:predicted DNA binding protein
MGNISLSAISVLESLISRLFESSLPLERTEPHTSDEQQSSDQQQQQPLIIDYEAENAHIAHIKEVIELICMEIVPYIPQINAILRDLVTFDNFLKSSLDTVLLKYQKEINVINLV